MSANNARPFTPPVPPQAAPGQERFWLRTIAEKLNMLLRRATPATLTLEAGATETTLFDERIGLFSAVHLQATSATAAATVGLWVEAAQGTATIHHDNTADLDRTFSVLIIG